MYSWHLLNWAEDRANTLPLTDDIHISTSCHVAPWRRRESICHGVRFGKLEVYSLSGGTSYHNMALYTSFEFRYLSMYRAIVDKVFKRHGGDQPNNESWRTMYLLPEQTFEVYGADQSSGLILSFRNIVAMYASKAPKYIEYPRWQGPSPKRQNQNGPLHKHSLYYARICARNCSRNAEKKRHGKLDKELGKENNQI